MENKTNEKRAVFAGGFDPFTVGHLEIAKRAAKVVDKLYICVAITQKSKPFFDVGLRIEMIKAATYFLTNVEVCSYNGLLTDFAEQNNIQIIVRGISSSLDFEHERILSEVYKSQRTDIECLYLLAGGEFAYINSTSVKELLGMGGDIKKFVPAECLKYIRVGWNSKVNNTENILKAPSNQETSNEEDVKKTFKQNEMDQWMLTLKKLTEQIRISENEMEKNNLTEEMQSLHKLIVQTQGNNDAVEDRLHLEIQNILKERENKLYGRQVL
jgi:pantetheine-phosphate adenylyltransferase